MNAPRKVPAFVLEINRRAAKRATFAWVTRGGNGVCHRVVAERLRAGDKEARTLCGRRLYEGDGRRSMIVVPPAESASVYGGECAACVRAAEKVGAP